MKKLVLLCLIVTSGIATAAFADGYHSAGCGLGSLVIKDEGFTQVFAATTNGTFGSQTFGISSGTSNCAGSGGYAKANAEQEMYVTSNFDSLTQEMAQGQGEHLNALANLMGCDKGANPHFNATMKANYRSFMSEKATPMDVLNKVKTTVSADPVLSKSCG